MVDVAAIHDMLENMRNHVIIDEDRLVKDVAILKAWLKQQPHLPQLEDDRMLCSFLIGCKNSTERCKKFIDQYYTVRRQVPEFFSNRDIHSSEIKEIFDAGFAIRMPKMAAGAVRVTMAGLLDKDKFKLEPYLKLSFMSIDMLIREEVPLGEIFIADLANAQLAHIGQFTISIINKVALCLQRGYPSRGTQIHVINAPSFVHGTISLAKSFMIKKLADRLHVHSDLESLHKHVSKDLLPDEYGGNAGTINQLKERCWADLVKYQDWLKNEGSMMCDESKRINVDTKFNNEDGFGVGGTFRKLNVD